MDRNCNDEKAVALDVLSSPARGTWIEIADSAAWKAINAVVPRKGDVDRNTVYAGGIPEALVVPRKGDVDRNAERVNWIVSNLCRPPQGGRG